MEFLKKVKNLIFMVINIHISLLIQINIFKLLIINYNKIWKLMIYINKILLKYLKYLIIIIIKP